LLLHRLQARFNKVKNKILNFFNDIVEKLNKILYVKPTKKSEGLSPEEKIKLRKEVSNLLFSVLSGERTVLRAVSNFPKNIDDESVNVCFHILMHLEADEDIRKSDEIYKKEQDDFILNIARLLEKGDDVPINIINEYNDFYKETLIYPEINKKTVISRLKKFINL